MRAIGLFMTLQLISTFLGRRCGISAKCGDNYEEIAPRCNLLLDFNEGLSLRHPPGSLGRDPDAAEKLVWYAQKEMQGYAQVPPIPWSLGADPNHPVSTVTERRRNVMMSFWRLGALTEELTSSS